MSVRHWIVAISWVALSVGAIAAAQEDERWGADGLKDACAPLAEQTHPAVVRVLDDGGRPVGLATLISASGRAVTKASLLPERLRVRLRSGPRFDATIVRIAEDDDLALIQLTGAKDLPFLELAAKPGLEQGKLLVAIGDSAEPLGVGVVSVPPRGILDTRVFLGITMRQVEEAVQIDEVETGSSADAAGIQKDDLLVEIAGTPVEKMEEVSYLVQQNRPGAEVGLVVMRGEERIELTATLGERPQQPQRQSTGRRRRQIDVNGELSERRDGFRLALQHDIPLLPRHCGGPLLGLDGRLIGINIARAGRTKTYAIPSAEVLDVLGLNSQDL